MEKRARQLQPGDVIWLPENSMSAGKLCPPSQATVKAQQSSAAVVTADNKVLIYAPDEMVHIVLPFCRNHIKTYENPTGTDCAAHLAEGRVFACPYRSPEHAQHGRMLDDQRVCPDFEPL